MSVSKRLRRPKLKDGELRIYWGRLQHDSPDIVFAWQGDRMMKRDTNYLHYALGCRQPDPKVQPLFSKMNQSFFEELDARGYDLTTLKFSIMKKKSAEQKSDSRGGEPGGRGE